MLPEDVDALSRDASVGFEHHGNAGSLRDIRILFEWAPVRPQLGEIGAPSRFAPNRRSFLLHTHTHTHTV